MAVRILEDALPTDFARWQDDFGTIVPVEIDGVKLKVAVRDKVLDGCGIQNRPTDADRMAAILERKAELESRIEAAVARLPNRKLPPGQIVVK